MYIHVCMHMHAVLCVRVCVHARLCVYVYVHFYVLLFHARVCVYVYTYVHICMLDVYVNVLMYTCIYTFMYVYVYVEVHGMRTDQQMYDNRYASLEKCMSAKLEAPKLPRTSSRSRTSSVAAPQRVGQAAPMSDSVVV